MWRTVPCDRILDLCSLLQEVAGELFKARIFPTSGRVEAAVGRARDLQDFLAAEVSQILGCLPPEPEYPWVRSALDEVEAALGALPYSAGDDDSVCRWQTLAEAAKRLQAAAAALHQNELLVAIDNFSPVPIKLRVLEQFSAQPPLPPACEPETPCAPSPTEEATPARRQRKRPKDKTHRQWLAWKQSGMSYAAVAQQHKDETGQEITPDAVYQAIRRLPNNQTRSGQMSIDT